MKTLPLSHSIALLTLCVSLSAPVHADSELFQQGQVYEQEQHWSEAFSAYSELIKREPTHAAAHYRLGVVSDRLGSTENALKLYQAALRLQPDMAEAKHALEGYYVRQGVMFRLNHQSDEALRAFQQALTYNPASASTHFEVGQEFEQRKQFDEALSAYKESLKLDANNSVPHIRLATIYSTQGQHAQAMQEFQEVLRLNPKDPAAHYGLGVAYNAQGQREQALASLKQAVRLYLIAGKREEARPAYTLQKQLEAQQGAPRSPGQR
ncbi:MAG: tetratricopeptide repeat protein [Deltaproteobacteria bacterium]|nr:tetratricopeptide repeat protein [Deltaproteobacteria bacterium]